MATETRSVPSGRTATLAETLASAAAQTYPNLEFLIVDDGSTDATAQIAAAFCAREPRARLLRKDNGGVASARNLGIEHARGEWVAPLDADDLWHPTKIAKHVAAAFSAPVRPGFVYCWHPLIDDRGAVITSGGRLAVDGRALYQLGYSNFVGNGSALLILREAALRVGGYDPSMRQRGGEGCEDHKLQILVARFFPIAAVPEHLVGYRSHHESMSRKGPQMLQAWLLLQEDLGREAIVPNRVRRWVTSACYLWFADSMIAARDFKVAVRAFAAALRLDPLRSSVMIVHRLLRLVVRVAQGRPEPVPGIPFSTADPSEVVRSEDFEVKLFSRFVRFVDEGRMRRLAASEPALTNID